MPTSPKTKIAILGGGVSAMTAAWYLSHAPDWQDHFEITIYQVGWRLGGKGASGRNQKVANRVEEHGFHFWWGFYDNAFRWMQETYNELNRPAGTPMATWQEAFKPLVYDVDMYFFGGQWTPRFLLAQINDWTPGLDPDPPTTTAQYISQALQMLLKGIETSAIASLNVPIPTSIRTFMSLPWWKHLLGDLTTGLGELTAIALLTVAYRLSIVPDDNPHDVAAAVRYQIIDLLVTAFITTLWAETKTVVLAETNFTTYNAFVDTDIVCSLVRGMIKDDIINNGYDSINQWDYRDWLGQRGGAQPVTQQSATVRGIYDMVFAYEDGVTPNLEAGTALRAFLRMTLDTRGPFTWHMESGMGDTIFAPVYEVLKQRGVKVKFFHRVEKLHLSPDGESIDGLTITRQVTIKDGQDYQPLVYPKGLPSWPNEPLCDQIVEGRRLRQRTIVAGYKQPKYNLESFWTPWKNAATLELKKGVDFDLVIVGTSIGPLRWLGQELLENPASKWDKWRNMMAHVKTVQTQAFQLWLKTDIAGLDQPYWRNGQTIVSSYDLGRTTASADSDNSALAPDTVDAWADMSHIIKRETWPEDHYPYNISYFCSAMRGPSLEQLPNPNDSSFPNAQFRQCKQNSLQFLYSALEPVWPGAVKPYKQYPACLNWDLLVDMEKGEGEARFDSQFWRANVDPSERYVLSVKGSTQYRLKTDETGCDNLYLTGDWIYNGANAGFVESAVISGLLTSQTITKKLLGKRYPEEIICWPDSPQP